MEMIREAAQQRSERRIGSAEDPRIPASRVSPITVGPTAATR